jgi:hypothetical protein
LQGESSAEALVVSDFFQRISPEMIKDKADTTCNRTDIEIIDTYLENKDLINSLSGGIEFNARQRIAATPSKIRLFRVE